jgi:hypothetical protein
MLNASISRPRAQIRLHAGEGSDVKMESVSIFSALSAEAGKIGIQIL